MGARAQGSMASSEALDDTPALDDDNMLVQVERVRRIGADLLSDTRLHIIGKRADLLFDTRFLITENEG